MSLTMRAQEVTWRSVFLEGTWQAQRTKQARPIQARTPVTSLLLCAQETTKCGFLEGN